MNKRAILFTTTVIIFLAGYLAYDTYFNNEKKILWDFVSNDAGIVVEFSLSNQIEESDLLDLHLDRLTPLINKQVDSIFFKDLRNRRYSKVLVSLHRVSNTATGLTFVIDVLNVSKSELLEYLSVNLDGNTSRKYLDQTIFEKKVDNDILSFQIIDNTLLLTKNAFLIEDVIRLSTSDQSQNFMSDNAEIMMLPKLANDAANIYINRGRLAGIKSTFESNVDNTIQAA